MRAGPRLAAATRTAALVQGRMKLARLMEMSEAEIEALARSLAASPLFARLRAAGVVRPGESPAARFAARRFAGYGLRLSGSGLPELVDGRCDLVRLMQDMGQERFETWFLGERACSDEERARACGISLAEARRLREFADRAFLQGEFEASAPAPAKVFSAVAGIGLEDGRPILAFFHREIWAKRWRVDRERLAGWLAALPPSEAARARSLASRLEAVEQRKATLYRLLELALGTQADYLRTGEPARRRPLPQLSAAASLGVDPSVVNRIISNKSVQLPWGLEAPLAVFFPSAKDINRERLDALAGENPGWKDEELRVGMERRYGVKLSRRSIAQYRKELGLLRRPSPGAPAS